MGDRDANDIHREQGEDGVRAMHDGARTFNNGGAGIVWSHIWRSKDPCTPTGIVRPYADGRPYAEVRTPDGTVRFVPQDELIPVQRSNSTARGENNGPAPARDKSETKADTELKSKPSPKPRLVAKFASEILAEAIAWVWEGRLAAGKLTLITWEIPRLCRGGSRSLTFRAVVHRGGFQS